MTPSIDILTHPLLASFDDFVAQRPIAAWVEDLRSQGAADFARLGLPTTRDEEWRQTNVTPIGKTAFTVASPVETIGEEQLAAFAVPGFDAQQLVFIDGLFVPGLSKTCHRADATVAISLAEAIEHHDDLVRAHLGRYATTEDEAFTALNAAYLEDGVFIHVPAGVSMEKPIHLLFISSDADQPVMSHPRVLVVVDEGGQVDVIEHHVAVADNVYLTNAVTEFVLGEHAKASHTFIERDSTQAYNISTLRVEQKAHSEFTSHSVLLGGKLVRNNVHNTFAGEYGHSVLNGIYLPSGEQHINNHMRVHHAAANCDSRQYYTGILSDQSSGAFIGRIVVDPGAQKTDAVQFSRGLLLSDDAYLHNRPQLEIFADDVKCTHGATIGELDKTAMFYLESRGIPEDVARGMLIYSFAGEALDRMTMEPVREELARLLVRQLGLSL